MAVLSEVAALPLDRSVFVAHKEACGLLAVRKREFPRFRALGGAKPPTVFAEMSVGSREIAIF